MRKKRRSLLAQMTILWCFSVWPVWYRANRRLWGRFRGRALVTAGIRRNCDASETVLVERESGCVFVTAGFYLDESERAAATRNDIDLASRHACPPRKDAPAPKP